MISCIGSVLSFVVFGGQTSKNLDDVQKVCFDMTLCVIACFVEFYVFVLDEIYVRGVKIIEDIIWVGKVCKFIPKDQPRVLEEGHKLVAKTSKRQSTYGGQSTASDLVDAP